METRQIVVDGHVRVYAKYRAHRKRAKGREYTYHTFEAVFDEMSYEVRSSTSEAHAKSILVEKLRIAIRDRSKGSLTKATNDRDVNGSLTEDATVSSWAELWCKELEGRAAAGDRSWTHAGRSRVIWNDHLRDAPVSMEDHRSLGSLKLVEVVPDHVAYALRIQGQRDHLKKGKDKPSKYSSSQKRQWRAFISGMYTYARGKGKNVNNPVGRFNSIAADAKKTKDILSKPEIRQLWKFIQGSPRDMLIVAFGLAFTRPGEIAGLDWTDIGKDELTIHRQGQAGRTQDKDGGNTTVTKRGALRVLVERAKTERSTGRSVDITPFIRHAITEARKAGFGMSGPVITDDDGQRVTSGWISAYVPKLLERAGIRRRNAYILKHTGCSHFLMDGGKLAELEKQSGVSAATLLRYYSHYIPSEAANRMGTWDLTAGAD